MLQVNQIDVYYGDLHILKNVKIDIEEGEIVSVIGANGAGKTTLVKAISGILRARSGSIHFLERKISEYEPDQIVNEGLVQVPEGRQLFPDMTVQENLEMGGFLIRDKERIVKNLKSVYGLFPVLKEREKQIAKTLSGGEQQMLAIGRALMSSPKLIMFDEPSLGLAPKMVQKVFENIIHINKELGITVLLIEQNVQHACSFSSRGFVLENGEIVFQATGRELLNDEHVRKAYMGM
jgi:branched-chain amino acid transport system ATP-binding protein